MRHWFLRTSAGIALACAFLGQASETIFAGVLGQDDRDQVSTIKTNFTAIMTDLSQSLRRRDLSEGDRACLDTISQDLIHVAQELSGYENLMTIETELEPSKDEETTRGVVLFALAKALDVLREQRSRLAQPPDSCARLPVSTGKAQSVVQVIDATIATLETLRSRL